MLFVLYNAVAGSSWKLRSTLYCIKLQHASHCCSDARAPAGDKLSTQAHRDADEIVGELFIDATAAYPLRR